MWSLGVITYILLCGFPPFNADNDAKLFKQIINCNYQFYEEDANKISKNAQDFISKLLVVDPE
jgi:serine/threonine protein kinase